MDVISRYRGCLLGGAVGDALGAPVEFLDLHEIVARYGEGGIRDFDHAYGGVGLITDDTQMTLFTAEGLLRAFVRGCLRGIAGGHFLLVKNAYLRWLETQFRDGPRTPAGDPGLAARPELYARRAPGVTCLSALKDTPPGEFRASNDSKGCGGVMRVAPAALFAHAARFEDRDRIFHLGADLAAMTHGHPTGQVASGTLVIALWRLLQGDPMGTACVAALEAAVAHPQGGETAEAIEKALTLIDQRVEPGHAVPRLGEGWIAEEALALAMYAALAAPDLDTGVRIAVNIQGDSDSVGAIAGNLLGAAHGEEDIPKRWLEKLELRETIGEMAGDFQRLAASGLGEYADAQVIGEWQARYPDR